MPIFEAARIHFPRYLTAEDSEELFSELEQWPDFTDYFGHLLEPGLLQGDGWHGFSIRNPANDQPQAVTGIVLSNTCDVSTENYRALPIRVIFAPLVSLDRYVQLLRDHGQTEDQIQGKLFDIRAQRVTSIFYLPPYSATECEHIALLDDVHSVPHGELLQSEPVRRFSLSNPGFYLFLLKLSIHFTRLGEGFSRRSQATEEVQPTAATPPPQSGVSQNQSSDPL